MKVGRIAGVAVLVDFWWVLITVAIAGAMYVRVSADTGALAGPIVVATVGALLVLASVVVHEVSHALMAHRLGIGVVSVSLFLFGGYSELEGEPERPRDELLVAGAGPLASLLLGGVLAALASVTPDALVGGGDVLRLLAVVNLAVALFNLLPGLPLDGGRVLRGIVWRITGDSEKATRVAARAGLVIGAAVALSGVVAIAVAGAWVWVWNTAVGLFLMRVAWEAGSPGTGRSAGAIVDPKVATVSRIETARVAAARLDAVGAEWPVVVVGSGRVVGTVERSALDRVPSAMVGDLMESLRREDVVDADTPIGVVLDHLRVTGRPVVVVRRGRTIGVLRQSDVDLALQRTA